LAGLFYSGSEERRIAEQAHTTPSMDVFYYDPVVPEPSMTVWRGSLKRLLPGRYNFRIEGSGDVKLFINDSLVAQHSATGSEATQKDVRLKPGENDIRVEYQSPSPPNNVRIVWEHEQAGMQPIPPDLLTPSGEHMFRIVE
jgi:hypothetical protein